MELGSLCLKVVILILRCFFLSPAEEFPSVLLSVTLFCPDAYLRNGFSDFIVILQENEHMIILYLLSFDRSLPIKL